MGKQENILNHLAFIDGQWTEGEGRYFSVINPFNHEEIAKVPDLDAKAAECAVTAAYRSFSDWSHLTAREREKYLLDLANAITAQQEKLANLITLEQGKPKREALDEVLMAVDAIRWAAAEGLRIHGVTQVDPDPTRQVATIRQPLGVVSVITPWNFPFTIPLQKSALALAAGCTVVLKPAEDTPLSAIAIAAICQQVGFPPGVFNVVTCEDPTKVGEVLTSHPLVAKICFTGSSQVGKQLLAQGASTIKRATLELGGNCPFLVFDDADLDKAVAGAMAMKFYNAGQCCIGLNRLLVQEKIHDAFIEKFSEQVAQLSLGDGQNDPDLGPLINQAAIHKIEQLMQDAKSHAATFVIAPKFDQSLLCRPVILTHATSKMRIWQEEIFGPVAPIYRFSTEAEGIAMANDTRYGLAAYFYSENIRRVMRVSRELQAGSVGINTSNIFSCSTPFGGWKESGLGREGGIHEGIHGFCELKLLSFEY